MSTKLKYDEIGYWSEVKLAILEEYAKPYNQILRSRQPGFHPIYIDGFAGAGHHKAKGSDRIIEGSPQRALTVEPPFEFFHFVDIDGARVTELKRLSSGRSNVSVYQGDCNEILTGEVFPRISYANFQRALCILDPYGLHLNWGTIQMRGPVKGHRDLSELSRHGHEHERSLAQLRARFSAPTREDDEVLGRRFLGESSISNHTRTVRRNAGKELNYSCG